VVLEPPVLVLDEPTTGLDFRECVKVMDVVRRLHAKGTTILMVCHDMEVVADYAERVMVMSDGRIIDQGPTFDVLRRRSTLEAASLVPPQIVSISLTLPRINPALSSTAIARANTLGQMHAAILHATTPDSADANVATTPEGALPEPAIRAQTAGGARTPSVFIDHEGAA
jgi:energy-coupling factor transport system ATP-binding protein